MIPSQEDIEAYCKAFGLVFKTHDELVAMVDPEDADEWENVRCAGILDEVHLVCVIHLTDHLVCRVVTRWADGRKLMKDRRDSFSHDNLMEAIKIDVPIHPESV